MNVFIKRKEEIQTEEYDSGPGALYKVAEAVGEPQGASFSVGVAEHWASAPSVWDYSNDGVASYMLEGTLHFRDQETGEESNVHAGDVWYIEKMENKVIEFTTPDYCKYFWCSYPIWVP